MNYQKMRIDFMQKRKTTAPFVYKTGEIDSDGIEAELVNIDVEGSPIGFIKLVSPNGAEHESALRIENGFAYFDIPKNEEGLYTVELTILNKKNKTRSGNINIEVINSLSYDSEEYETLLDTITKNDAEYTSNENIRIENEKTRIETFDGIKTDFENLTVGKQLDSEVIIARNGKASLKDNIESKRDKSVLLTQTDLSTSSESHKLTPNHLNQAVKDMMTGSTPVSPNIADGQVTTQKIADKAVTFSKLADRFSEGALLSAVDLNTITKTGYYRYNGFTCTNTPVLNVHGLLNHAESYLGTNAIQTVHLVDSRDVYTRTRANSTTWNAWKRIYPVSLEGAWNEVASTTTFDTFNPADVTASGVYFSGRVIGSPTTSYGSYSTIANVASNTHKTYTLTSIQDGLSNQWQGTKWYNSSTIHWQKYLFERDLFSYGRRLLILGDSIANSLDSGKFTKKSGFVVSNKAKGGSSFAKRASMPEWDEWATCEVVKKGAKNEVDIENTDVILIFGGANDIGHDIPFGNSDSTNEYEVNGALNNMLTTIYARNPKVLILFVTPIYRVSRMEVNPPSVSNKQFTEMIKAKCVEFNIPFFDSYTKGQINKLNYSAYLQSDGLHLSAFGIASYSSILANFVDSVVF